jgi:hypothetical protein
MDMLIKNLSKILGQFTGSSNAEFLLGKHKNTFPFSSWITILELYKHT